MSFGATFLNDSLDGISAVIQNLLDGLYNAIGLIEKDVERPWGGAGGYDNRFFPFLFGGWYTVFPFTNEAINHSVEQNFQISVHVSPIAWRTYNQYIGVLNLLQSAVSVVFGQLAEVLASAIHATNARTNQKSVNNYIIDFSTL